jgi:hypothetical protein
MHVKTKPRSYQGIHDVQDPPPSNASKSQIQRMSKTAMAEKNGPRVWNISIMTQNDSNIVRTIDSQKNFSNKHITKTGPS